MARDDAVIKIGLEVGDLKAGLESAQRELKQTAAVAAKSSAKMDDTFAKLAQQQKQSALETKAAVAAIRQQGREIATAAGHVSGMSDELKKQTGIVDKLRAKADATERELDKLFKEGRLDVKQYAQELKRLRGNLDGLGGKTGGPLSALKNGWVQAGIAIAGAYAALRTFQTGLRALDSAFETSAKVEALRQGLVNLAGDSARAEAALEAVQRATNGTVSEMEAMRIANTAMSFGIVQNAEQLEQLSEIGVTLGRSLGIDAEQAVSDLTLALSRQSPKILDNLGITLKLEEAYDIYAKSIGTTADQLTESEKQQAFLNAALIKGREKLEQLGGSIRTNADGWLRFKARLEDARVEFATAISKSEGMGEGLDDLADSIDRLIPKLVNAAKEMAPVITGLADFTAGVIDALTATGEIDADQFSDPITKAQVKIKNQILGLQEAARGVREELADAEGFGNRDLIDDAQQRLLDITLQIKPLSQALRELEKSRKSVNLPETTGDLGDFGDGLDPDGDGDGDGGPTGAAKKLAEALKEISDAATRFGDLASEVGLVRAETSDQIELLDTLAQGAKDAEAALLGLWLDGKINAEQYNERLQAILQSEAEIAQQRSEIVAGDRAGFVEMLTQGLGGPETQRSEGGALGAGGFGDFAQGELGAASASEQAGFEDETGFSIMDVLKPGFDVDQALENWDTVTTAMQDGTLGLVDAQEQLAESGFRVDSSVQATLKSFAKQAKAAQTQQMALKLVGQAAGNLASGLIQMAISGEGSFKKLLQAELSSIATSSASKAIQMVAEGFAAKARHDYGAASAAFTSAKFHAKVAAFAAGGAIALGGGGGGDGDGGGRGRDADDYSSQRDTARTQELTEQDEGRGGPGVTVVIDGGNFIGTPDEEVGRAIADIVEGAVADAAGGSNLRGG